MQPSLDNINIKEENIMPPIFHRIDMMLFRALGAVFRGASPRKGNVKAEGTWRTSESR